MNPLHKYHVSLREAFSAWQMFRQLGYTTDEIFFVCNNEDGGSGIQVLLLSTHGVTFGIDIAIVGFKPEVAEEMWKQLCADVGTDLVSDKHIQEVYEASEIHRNINDITFAMSNKGLGVNPRQVRLMRESKKKVLN